MCMCMSMYTSYVYTCIIDAYVYISGQVLDLLEGQLGTGAVSDDDLLCMGVSMLVRAYLSIYIHIHIDR